MTKTEVGPTVIRLLYQRGMQVGVTNDYDYIKAGIVDSLDLLGFVLDLEAALSVTLTDADVASDEFRTVGGLIDLIEKKLQ